MGNYKNRRSFLRQLAGVGCASLSLTPFMSGITNLGLLNAAITNNRSIYKPVSSTDYKALVCIMLSGGNDSFNMLVPYDQANYDAYEQIRGGVNNSNTNPSGMAIERASLKELGVTINGAEYGLHPQMGDIQNLFKGTDTNYPGEQYVSFVANVGTLLKNNYTLANFNDGLDKPYQIGSHSDQSGSWQTCMVGSERGATGWGGRMADLLHQNNVNPGQDVSMNISLSGSNGFQSGNQVSTYSISPVTNSGGVLVNSSSSNANRNANKLQTLDALFEANYQGILEKAYARELQTAKTSSSLFSTGFTNAPTFTHPFPNTTIGNQLKAVAKAIAVKDQVGTGFSRQTFFVNMPGFDNHSDLISTHSSLMKQLNDAIYAFYRAMKELETINEDPGFAEKVTGFTISDFARMLSSNSNGTDHAWGGHHLVFGGAIDGGKIFGEYPDLVNLTLDIGGGRFIPSTSCDEYFADLALWFADNGSTSNGFSSLTYQDLKDILPNIAEFIPQTLNQVDNVDRLGLFS